VPVKTDNGMIRLGDIVVSKPAGGHSGAVQYDHGKAKVGQFERIGALAPPPAVLLNAAQDLAAKRARSRSDPVDDNIKRIDIHIRGLRRYKNPGGAQDHLYRPNYIHREPGVPCDDCHERSRHIDISYHYVRDLVQKGRVIIDYIPTVDMVADGFTKPLERTAFDKFKGQLGMCSVSS